MTHIEKADNYFLQKFHCSQAVLAAFAEELSLSEEAALKLGSCFGGGMCLGEVCGACTGALMALGLKYGHCEATDLDKRAKSAEIAVRFLEQFRAENGSYQCKELLGCDLATPEGKEQARSQELFVTLCPKLVHSAAELTEQLWHE